VSDIHLSKAVRSNLLSLQSTATQMATTQNKLATGLKVNSALDNPTNFFTASQLNSRASDMANLLDSMSSGIKTIEAADNGLKSITKTVEMMQSTLRQARQDKSFKSQSYTIAPGGGVTPGLEAMGLAGGGLSGSSMVYLSDIYATKTAENAYTALDFDNAGAFGESLSFSIALNGGATHSVAISATNATTLAISIDGGAASTATIANANAVSLDELSGALDGAFGTAGLAIDTSNAGGKIAFSSTAAADYPNADIAITGITASNAPVLATSLGFTAGGVGSETHQLKSVDRLVAEINGNSALNSAVRATSDAGKLRFENLSNQDLTVNGTSGSVIDSGIGSTVIGGNDVRTNLVGQFNNLRDQLDKFADDASFNGINLLRGDKLKLTFNETGTSNLEVQTSDETGTPTPINTSALGIDAVTTQDLSSDANIDARLDAVKTALDSLRSQSSSMGSKLSVVENRTAFTKSMVNTLETGAANLTLADTNEEAANLLALQTRQQLSSTALSMASQADQAVLRLF
jgi:flagellin